MNFKNKEKLEYITEDDVKVMERMWKTQVAFAKGFLGKTVVVNGFHIEITKVSLSGVRGRVKIYPANCPVNFDHTEEVTISAKVLMDALL